MRVPWMALGILVLAAGSGPAAFAQRADDEARIRRTIRFLKPDIAVVEGVWELSGLRGPDGKEMPPVKGLSLAVYVNKGREWLLAVGQTMLPAPASPAAPVI